MPPPPEAGFVPPKNGTSKVPSDFGRGWRDSNGNIWVPDSSGHGGEHWDVYRKDGKGYTNVYPNGHRRAGKGKEPNLPTTSPQPNASPAPSPTPSAEKIVKPSSIPSFSSIPLPQPTRLQPPDDLPEPREIEVPSWLGSIVILGATAATGYFLGPSAAAKIESILKVAFGY